MNTKGLRVQLLSDSESIDAIGKIAAMDSVATEPAELPASDQRFGIAEAAGIIAVIHTSAEIALLLAKAFKLVRGQKKITLRTPRGSVTIEGDATTAEDVILAKIKAAAII
jgi:hypothetical protein